MTSAGGAARRTARWRRLAGVMLLDGFRAAPGWMSFVTALLILGSVSSTCYPLGYRLLVDGALRGSAPRAAAGVAVVGGLISLGWLLTSIGGTDAMALSDRIAAFRTSRLIGLIGGVCGIDHLERPDYLTNVERINANRRQLAAAPRQMLTNLASLARILTLLVLLASVSWWLLLLPLSAVPPMLADRVAKRLTRQVEDDMGHDRRLADMVFALSTDVSAAAEIRSYGLARFLAGVHRQLTDRLDRRSTRQAVQVLAVQGLGWLLYAIALMGAIAFVVVRAADGAMSVGTVLMSVSLIRRSRNQLASAASNSGTLINTLTTADRLFWLEDHAATQAAVYGHAVPPPRLAEGISLRDVGFVYPGTDRPVLDGFSVDIPAGATVALVGENGSGKTTLVKLLLGLYRPTAGDIRIDGHRLADLDPEAWRLRCSAAFQDFSRLQLIATESVGVADLPGIADEQAAERALERAGAADLRDQLPEGLATQVGTAHTGGHNLSGGQWQKLALGRAMRRPEPLFVALDEPTAALDAAAENALFERYAVAAATTATRTGAVTLLVSHRFSTVAMADLIVYLESGRAAEVGSHDQLVAAGGRYAELFTLQAAGYA